jgi:hypothetical protein
VVRRLTSHGDIVDGKGCSVLRYDDETCNGNDGDDSDDGGNGDGMCPLLTGVTCWAGVHLFTVASALDPFTDKDESGAVAPFDDSNTVVSLSASELAKLPRYEPL